MSIRIGKNYNTKAMDIDLKKIIYLISGGSGRQLSMVTNTTSKSNRCWFGMAIYYNKQEFKEVKG